MITTALTSAIALGITLAVSFLFEMDIAVLLADFQGGPEAHRAGRDIRTSTTQRA